MTVNEVIQNQMKNYFNKMRPKFGIKNYDIKDNMHKEPYHKVKQISLSKNPNLNGVFDQYLKLKAQVPPAKYE